MITNSRTVNIRSGPGTQYPQIGEVNPGANFYFTGVTKNGFRQIIYPSTQNNPGYNASAGGGDLYVEAYVARSLSTVSPVGPQDVILSSLVGNLKAKPGAVIYLDAALERTANGAFGDSNCVPFAGVSPNGTYAVLYTRRSDKGEQVLWIGYISPNDVESESRLGG